MVYLFRKNISNKIIYSLSILTLFVGFFRWIPYYNNPHNAFIREFTEFSEEANSLSSKINSLISEETYSSDKTTWEDLSQESNNLVSEFDELRNDKRYGSIYLPFSSYITSLNKVALDGEKLSQRSELDDSDEEVFNDLINNITESNNNLEILKDGIDDSLSQDELSELSLNEINVPELPNTILVAKEEKARQEQERIEAEQKAEEERIAAEQERIAAEQKAEEERVAAERAEQERIAAEQQRQEQLATEVQSQNRQEDNSSGNLEEGSFILNTNSGKLHRSYCRDVSKMKESNKSYIEGPIDLDEYDLCKHCF